METNHDDRWVAGQLALLDPEWRPDLAHGRSLLEEGLKKPARSSSWMVVAAAAAVCIAAVALPQTRAFAQQLWSRFVLNRVDVVRIDLSDLPLRAEVTGSGPPQVARDLEDAEQKAGFRPNLPLPGTLPANPSITIVGLMSAVQTIHVPDLEAALQKVGARDVHVPPEWEGVQVRALIGPMVSLGYPDEVGILQARPIELTVPAGFALQHFAEVAFRSIGVSPSDAASMARKFAANPAWFMGIPSGEMASVQEVSLRAGPALLVEEFDDDGKPGRITVFRSTSERIYCVLANDRQLALKIADALP